MSGLIKLRKAQYILTFVILVSCAPKQTKTANDIKTVVVTRQDFENTVQVSGVLEASRSISKSCPVNGYDIRIVELIESGTYTTKGDTICRLECADLTTAYNNAIGAVEWAKSNYEKTKANQESEISILASQLKSNEASTQIAMLDSARLKFMSPTERRITELNLEKVKIQQDILKKKLESKIKINKAVLKAFLSKQAREERNLKQAQDKLNKLFITADTSGLVIRENLFGGSTQIKLGDIIWGNAQILKIIDISTFQVRLFVNENQYQSIQNGQSIEMCAEANPKLKFTGKILQKKPSGRPIKAQSTVKQFECLASIDSISPINQPGVSILCKVYLSKVKDTIVAPIMAIFEEDSIKVAYVRKKDKFVRQEVITGNASDKYIIVSKGLKPNDQISLTVPPEYLVEEKISTRAPIKDTAKTPQKSTLSSKTQSKPSKI